MMITQHVKEVEGREWTERRDNDISFTEAELQKEIIR